MQLERLHSHPLKFLVPFWGKFLLPQPPQSSSSSRILYLIVFINLSRINPLSFFFFSCHTGFEIPRKFGVFSLRSSHSSALWASPHHSHQHQPSRHKKILPSAEKMLQIYVWDHPSSNYHILSLGFEVLLGVFLGFFFQQDKSRATQQPPKSSSEVLGRCCHHVGCAKPQER